MPRREEVEDDRKQDIKQVDIPVLKSHDDYCVFLKRINSKIYHLFDSTNPIEVLWPEGCPGAVETYAYDQYIVELFPSPYFKIVNKDTAKFPRVFICTGSSRDADIINNFLPKASTTTILVHLNDEYMGKNKEANACLKLYPMVTLVLKEYANYTSVKGVTIHQLPLGYNQILRISRDDFYQHFSALDYSRWSFDRKISDRKYKWSFIGTIYRRSFHADRISAVGIYTHIIAYIYSYYSIYICFYI